MNKMKIISDITDGKVLMFTGHRYKKLYGSNLNDKEGKYYELRRAIREFVEKLVLEKNVRCFITGGALGLDTIAFFVGEDIKRRYPELNIKNILAIPYKEQDSQWKPEDKERYERIKSWADLIINVSELKEYNAFSINDKLQKRNEFMVDNGDFAFGLWDGKVGGGTYNCIKYIQELKNPMPLYIMNPKTLKTIDFTVRKF